MTIKVKGETYETAEEFITALEAGWEKETPKLLRPLRRYLRNKSLANYNLWAYVTHPKYFLRLPDYYWSKVRWFVQRGRRGYSEYDLWGLDSYILSWLPEALGEMADTAHGHPVDTTYEEWVGLLRGCSNSLKEIRREVADLDPTDDTYVRFEKTWKKIGKNFFSLWD